MEDASGSDADRVVGSIPGVDNFKGNTEIVEPRVWMIFHSTEEIKAFYQKYMGNHPKFGAYGTILGSAWNNAIIFLLFIFFVFL